MFFQVPADNTDEWKVEPFDGELKGNYIYGRGTIDDKQQVMVTGNKTILYLFLSMVSLQSIS